MMVLQYFVAIFSLFSLTLAQDYVDDHCQGSRRPIVQLFEWSWDAVAEECVTVLGPRGYCGVQVSPPQEHILGEEWWTRYQAVSYKLESRSGSREQFINMVNKCNDAGVMVLVDAIINHMTGVPRKGEGTGGSLFVGRNRNYTAVPYTEEDFHEICLLENGKDVFETRNCMLVGLNDLDQSREHVREMIAGYLNDLINIGVKGFRVDASKHMWPEDLEAIWSRLSKTFDGHKPVFIHEVIDYGNSCEGCSVQNYYHLGKVTEFRYGDNVSKAVKRSKFFKLRKVYDEKRGMADSAHAAVFIDNHDNQRHKMRLVTASRLEDHDDRLYKMAVSFMLAHDYGFKRVMSSFYFNHENNTMRSPETPPQPYPGPCGNGWTCEHRWNTIVKMVEFSNIAGDERVRRWSAGEDYLGFARGDKAFMAMGQLGREFNTGLADGEYCDIISNCQQKISITRGRGFFQVFNDDDPVVAICVGCQ